MPVSRRKRPLGCSAGTIRTHALIDELLEYVSQRRMMGKERVKRLAIHGEKVHAGNGPGRGHSRLIAYQGHLTET